MKGAVELRAYCLRCDLKSGGRPMVVRRAGDTTLRARCTGCDAEIDIDVALSAASERRTRRIGCPPEAQPGLKNRKREGA